MVTSEWIHDKYNEDEDNSYRAPRRDRRPGRYGNDAVDADPYVARANSFMLAS